MSDNVDDRELLKRLAKREPAAARLLFERHHGRVFRFVLRIVRNEAAADEIANEVFLEVWRQAATYEGRSAAMTWILSIAYYRATSTLRRKGEVGLAEEHTESLADDAPDPETALVAQDKAVALRRCLEALSAEHRAVIDLVYYQELSVADASAVAGVPEGTVKTRLFNARKRLSALLRDVSA